MTIMLLHSANKSLPLKHEFMQFIERETTQLLIFFVVVLYASVLVIDKVKRSRKRCPPGPIGLPFFGSLPFLGEEPHKTMVELGKKYGNIFSLYMGTKYTVVLNDYESMKEGLNHPAALDRAPNLFDHVKGGVGFEGLNGLSWQEQRRFCMQAMRDLGFGKGSWEVLIHEEISSFIEELEELDGKAVDVAPHSSTSISNNVISLLIGRRLQREEESDIVKLFYDFGSVSFKFMGPSDPASLVPGFRKFLELFKIAGYDKVPTITNKANKFIREEINRQKSSKESREIQNFINRYLDQLETTDESKEKRRYAFSEKMLEGNINILFLAGSDTIFNSLCFMVRLMAAYPDVQKKIHEELDSVIGRDGRARFEERSKTPYTFASILEGQRFSTIVPLSTTRIAREDFELGGYIIPKGAEIFGNQWAVHNDPRYWKEPEIFLPERFLSEDRSKLLKLPSYAPFSLGKRNCPGETVAYMEMYLYFSTIMQKFNITAPPGEEINLKIKNGLVIQLEPQNLHFTLRDL